jgi:hypothetical protein
VAVLRAGAERLVVASPAAAASRSRRQPLRALGTCCAQPTATLCSAGFMELVGATPSRAGARELGAQARMRANAVFSAGTVAFCYCVTGSMGGQMRESGAVRFVRSWHRCGGPLAQPAPHTRINNNQQLSGPTGLSSSPELSHGSPRQAPLQAPEHLPHHGTVLLAASMASGGAVGHRGRRAAAALHSDLTTLVLSAQDPTLAAKPRTGDPVMRSSAG